jgi:putative spermidine/putrescine transport system substrate-binding protein
VYADYGGTTRAARQKAYSDSFTKRTGINVIYADADNPKFVLMAEQGNVQWDAMDANNYEFVEFINLSLLAKLPRSVPRADMVVEPKYRDYASAAYTFSYLQAYRTDVFTGAGPQSWADFWDTKRFPGKRAFPTDPNGVFEIALIADGVAANRLYPLNFKRALAKLDQLRPNLLFYNSQAEGQQFLASGTAHLGTLANARAYNLTTQGVPLKLVWNQALLAWSAPAVQRRAPHLDGAFKWIAWQSNPRRQAEFARITHYGPTMKAAFKYMDQAVINSLPSSPQHAKVAVKVNAVALARQFQDYENLYAKWLAGG